jgi:hypothetical protein
MFSTYQLGNINLYSVMWVGGPALVVVAAIDMLRRWLPTNPQLPGSKEATLRRAQRIQQPGLDTVILVCAALFAVEFLVPWTLS